MKKAVAGYNNLYKDVDSGVIVNRESIDRQRYKILKRQSINNMDTQYEIASLKQELNEIKELLHQLLVK